MQKVKFYVTKQLMDHIKITNNSRKNWDNFAPIHKTITPRFKSLGVHIIHYIKRGYRTTPSSAGLALAITHSSKSTETLIVTDVSVSPGPGLQVRGAERTS